MKNDFDQLTGFQWDPGNSRKNLIKHGVEDWEGEQVFFNRPLIILDGPKHSQIEDRWAALGRSDSDRLLVVVFTKRGHLIRIISARDMDRKEKRFYEEAD